MLTKSLPANPPGVAIIGAGHNGLVCAYYLARAGCQVEVFEGRSVVGGAVLTQEFHPGFRNSVASYTVSLLDESVIAEMGLRAQGLRIVERPLANFLPLEDARALHLGGGLAATQASLARFSQRDAERLPGYYALLERVGDALARLAREAPPAWEGEQSWLDWSRSGSSLLGRARELAQLNAADRQMLLRLLTDSAEDVLAPWFDSDPVRAAFSFDAVVGHLASPRAPGTAYVLLHHCFGGVNGKRGQWGHAIGGMGAISEAMARACVSLGVRLHCDAPVARVVVERDAVIGIELASGAFRPAQIVACNAHPRILADRLLAGATLPEDFRVAMRHYRSESGTFRMNLALSGLPRFSAAPESGPHLASGIILSPGIQWMEAAYRDAIDHGMSQRPIVEMLIPSTLDDSLAPPGAHVASLFCQHFRRELPNGACWDDAHKNRAIEAILGVVESFAPGFRRLILGMQALSPLDLEQGFGLVGGDIFHGRMSLAQLWAARPALGWGRYRMPLHGLYLCGSGAHPGGGVSGLPGRNAARQILDDQSAARSLLSRALSFRRQP